MNLNGATAAVNCKLLMEVILDDQILLMVG